MSVSMERLKEVAFLLGGMQSAEEFKEVDEAHNITNEEEELFKDILNKFHKITPNADREEYKILAPVMIAYATGVHAISKEYVKSNLGVDIDNPNSLTLEDIKLTNLLMIELFYLGGTDEPLPVLNYVDYAEKIAKDSNDALADRVLNAMIQHNQMMETLQETEQEIAISKEDNDTFENIIGEISDEEVTSMVRNALNGLENEI